MHIKIRKMTASDIEQIRYIATKSWHDTYIDSIPLDVRTRFLKKAYNDESLLYRLKNSHFYVAQITDHIVGFANFSLLDINQQVELGALYLLPSVKGKGIGTKLLNKGIENIGNVKQVLVHVEKNNQTALHFYKQRGFIFVKELNEYFYQHPLQTIQLMLHLS